MLEKEMIELAAKALGWASWDWLAGDRYLNVYDANGRNELFSPLANQADNDRMGCDLEIAVFFELNAVVAESTASYGNRTDTPLSKTVEHDGTIEGRRSAVRLARTQVAAQMGRAK